MRELVEAIRLEAGFQRYLAAMCGRQRLQARWEGPRERAWYVQRQSFRAQWGIG